MWSSRLSSSWKFAPHSTQSRRASAEECKKKAKARRKVRIKVKSKEEEKKICYKVFFVKLADLHSFHFILELLNSIPSHSRARPSEASDIASLFSSLRPNQTNNHHSQARQSISFSSFLPHKKKIQLHSSAWALRAVHPISCTSREETPGISISSTSFPLFLFHSWEKSTLFCFLFFRGLSLVWCARDLCIMIEEFLLRNRQLARAPHTGQRRWTTLLNIGNDVPRRCDFLACVIFSHFFGWNPAREYTVKWSGKNLKAPHANELKLVRYERARETSTVAQETFCVWNI